MDDEHIKVNCKLNVKGTQEANDKALSDLVNEDLGENKNIEEILKTNEGIDGSGTSEKS